MYFKIADGNSAHVGKEASLKADNAKKYLSDVGPQGPGIVQAQYKGAPSEEVSHFKGKLKQQWAVLDFSGNHAQVTLNSIWDQSYTPIPVGTHLIMAPDQSHGNIPTSGYRQNTAGLKCPDVWFPIQVAGVPGPSGRYVHVGHLSEGCVTVHELTKWNAVYDYLIAHRMPGAAGRFIGSFVVRS